MGKEWFYWGNGGSRSTKRSGKSQDHRDNATPGCMCAVLQLFDFHQFQFSSHQQPSFNRKSFLPEEPIILNGVEAPRNSLELEEAFMGATSLSTTMKEGKNLNIQMDIKVKTRVDSSRSSLECGSSPGDKTPNLVARLMGLDQLIPETSSSPSFSSSSNHSNRLSKSHLQYPRLFMHNLNQDYFQSRQMLQSQSCRSTRNRLDTDIMGTLSLPETPRISLARRSDVDHHRLSLQINKENICASEELEFPNPRSSRRRELRQEDENENRSPSNYARQIVRQVKESVSRKVGIDISNTVKNREREHVIQLKSKKPSKGLSRIGEELSPSKQLTQSSSSPRLRFSEPKSKPVTTPAYKNQNSQSPKLLLSSENKPEQPAKFSQKQKIQPWQDQQKKQNHHPIQKKCKKAVSERFRTPSLKKPTQTSDPMWNKQEEPFVRSNLSGKKCKKTPLSSDLLNVNVVPTVLSVKKEPSPSPSKLTQKQLFNSSSKREALTVQDSINNDRSNGATTGDWAELQYIKRIMKCTGIDKNTPASFTKWYSPSHPLDPSIFYHLELSFPTTTAAAANSQLNQWCNRKLLFQLVDEILAEFLRPYMNLKPWVTSITSDYKIYGTKLIDKLCTKIRSFPAADCKVLEDIDAVIETDLSKNQLVVRSVAFEEETEGIVSEIERDIVESLVHETALEVFDVAAEKGLNRI